MLRVRCLSPHRRGYGGLLLAMLLVALACPLVPAAVRAQVGPADATHIDEYRMSLLAAQRALMAEPPDLDGARAALIAAGSVMLRSGATAATAPLLGDEGASLDPAAARARVETALQQLDASAGDRAAERLRVLDAVLASPAFQNSESLLDRLRRWLAEFLARFFPETGRSGQASPVATTAVQIVGWTVVAGAAIVLLLLLSRWLRTLLQAFVGDAALSAGGSDGEPATAAEARAAAGRSAQAGDYRSAVRQLYLAALLTLQEQRIASRDRSLTNRELLARVPGDHPAHAHLQPVVEVFDDVWYGVHEPDGATFDRYQAEVDALERSVARPAPHAGDAQ